MFKLDKYLVILVIAVVCLILGFILANFELAYYSHSSELYKIRLFEVCQYITTLLIAIFLSYFISRRVSLDGKQREIVIKMHYCPANN